MISSHVFLVYTQTVSQSHQFNMQSYFQLTNKNYLRTDRENAHTHKPG